jgi:hypothetical protein
VTPVAETSTLTAIEPTSNRRKVNSAADDEAIMIALSAAAAVALSAAASHADGGEIPSLTTSGDDTAVDISGTVSGSDSSVVNSGAQEFNPISHRMAGTDTDNERVEVVDGKLEIAAAASETGMSKVDAEATLQVDGSDATNALVITDGTNADTTNLPGHYTINTAQNGRGGKVVHDTPVSATGETISVHSTSAENDITASSPFTETVTGNLLRAFAAGPAGRAHPALDNLREVRPYKGYPIAPGEDVD